MQYLDSSAEVVAVAVGEDDQRAAVQFVGEAERVAAAGQDVVNCHEPMPPHRPAAATHLLYLCSQG